MGDIVPLEKRAGRRLKETIFTDRGLRLANPPPNRALRWFTFAIVILPVAVFLAVAFAP